MIVLLKSYLLLGEKVNLIVVLLLLSFLTLFYLIAKYMLLVNYFQWRLSYFPLLIVLLVTTALIHYPLSNVVLLLLSLLHFFCYSDFFLSFHSYSHSYSHFYSNFNAFHMMIFITSYLSFLAELNGIYRSK